MHPSRGRPEERPRIHLFVRHACLLPESAGKARGEQRKHLSPYLTHCSHLGTPPRASLTPLSDRHPGDVCIHCIKIKFE